MDFERNLIKILCITSPDSVRGLQWALDRQEFSDRKYQLAHLTLAQLQQAPLPEFDCSVATIDLGQPVPLESLKKLGSKPGLCAFMHPTPQQLLSLAEMPRWVSTAWDGVNFEKLVQRIDDLSQRLQNDIKIENFIEMYRSWERLNQREPDILEWTNPPESQREARHFYLDASAGQVLIGEVRDQFGAAQNNGPSNSSIRIAPTGVGSPVAELRFLNTEWRIKVLDSQWQARIRAPDRGLRHGDVVQIGNFEFMLKLNRNSEKLQTMARKFGLSTAGSQPQFEGDAPKTVSQFSRELMLSGVRGELRLSAGLKHGTLFFEDGFCVHAVTGSVSGTKALMRMWGWESPKWRFNSDKQTDWRTTHMDITEYDRLYRYWSENWRKLAHLLPPPQLKLQAHPARFAQKIDWNSNECQVMASVCEYFMVRDILNHCRLDDVTIIETLIQMRRQGLIVVAA